MEYKEIHGQSREELAAEVGRLFDNHGAAEILEALARYQHQLARQYDLTGRLMRAATLRSSARAIEQFTRNNWIREERA